jgi:hypothetical protein
MQSNLSLWSPRRNEHHCIKPQAHTSAEWFKSVYLVLSM